MNKILCFIFIASLLVGVSCSDSNKSGVGSPHDPNKPVELVDFYPKKGGIATKVILKGNNFGIDKEEIKVFFNEKEAAVIETNGEMVYVITPRQPGDECNIKVQIGDKEYAYTDQFEYVTQITVTTVTGAPGSSEREDGTLATALFKEPWYLTVDDENNIYLTDRADSDLSKNNGRLCLINEESDLVLSLSNTMWAANVPCMDPTGEIILVPDDAGTTYYEFNKNLEYSMKRITPGKGTDWSFGYKHSLAPCTYDGLVYGLTRNQSYLYSIDVKARYATMIPVESPNNAWWFITFDPTEPYMLYAANYHQHCIYRYDVRNRDKTIEEGNRLELFAGKPNQSGFADGECLDAMFSEPRQISFDYDGNLFVADAGNHVIRKIDKNGMVSLVIGLPGKSGYIDGGPDYALFNQPYGVTVNKDNVVYIADNGNKCVRKLAIE